MAKDYTKLAAWLALAEAIEDENVVLRTDSDGVLLKNASGALATTCYVSGGCEYCDGATPDTFEVITSGIYQICCVQGSFIYGIPSSKLVALDISGPVTLTRSLTCTWIGSMSVSFNRYSNTDETPCTTYGDTVSGSMYFTLTKTSDTAWLFVIEAGIGSVYYNLFHSAITGQNVNCAGPLSFTNDITTCGGSNYGKDGSATVSIP